MWTIPFRISSSERASVAFDQKRERDALAVISLPPVSSQQTFHLNEATLKHWRVTHRRWAPQDQWFRSPSIKMYCGQGLFLMQFGADIDENWQQPQH